MLMIISTTYMLSGKELLGLVGERGSASALMASLRRASEGGADAEETVRYATFYTLSS
jgi:hypothetical protein